mmetsp:Transcript_333/g.873  ORF Transcript_333/g.873 Transcript_333/m.873 type:complete len:1169 (+) Transcript_333:36-3542(+)
MLGSVRIDVQQLQSWLDQIEEGVKVVQDAVGSIAASVDIGDQAVSESPSTEGTHTPKPGAVCISQALPVSHASSQLFDEKPDRFEIQPNGVPAMTKAAPKRHSILSSKSTVSISSLGEEEEGFRLLDEWGETFVLCEQEAIDTYNALYRDKDVARVSRKRPSQLGLGPWDCRSMQISDQLQELLRLWKLLWDFVTVLLVTVDAVMLPLLLAWPADDHSFWSNYYKATPVFWVADIIVMYMLALLMPGDVSRIRACCAYASTWFPLDLFVVTLDLVLLAGLVPDDFKAMTMMRLVRTAKFRNAITTVESRLAARGMLKAVNLSTILQCVIFIFGVNHALACITVYVGRRGQEEEILNWLDVYSVDNHPIPFQYMISFNWVIAEYTPAPYPFTAQNEMEQALMLAIILTCLPMLGAQIGIISGTLNLMTEKAKERDHVKRDLQRWLRKTNVSKHLHQRVVTALDDVLGSSESPLEVKEPLALDFLPSTLIESLRVVKTGEKLAIHPFYSLLMDERVEFSGKLAAAFHQKVAVQGEQMFSSGRKAKGVYIAVHGSFVLRPAKETDPKAATRARSTRTTVSNAKLYADSWFAELALYTTRTHAATLTSATYAKLLTCSAQDLIQVVKNAPAVVVGIHEYALALIKMHQRKSHFNESTWEIPPDSWAEEAVAATQLAELLNPGTSPIHAFKLTEDPDTTVSLHHLLNEDLSLLDQIDYIKDELAELADQRGMYELLHIKDEARRAILSILMVRWLVRDDYSDAVANQDGPHRLTRTTWSAIRDLTGCQEMTFDQLNAAMVLLGVRGLCKSQEFGRLVPPSERRSLEQVLCHTVEHLDAYVPSLRTLAPESYTHLSAAVRIMMEFNFAQFVQGENNPNAVWLLQCALCKEGQSALKLCLLVQVCVLCGVGGAVSVNGSAFLTELNGRAILKALSSLEEVEDLEPHVIFWRYISSRAEALSLTISCPQDLVLARIACLTRTLERGAFLEVQEDWMQLTEKERDTLHDVFLLDGHDHKAFLFLYLPLFLTNARANHDLGLTGALKFLVELYEKLIRHKCLNLQGPTVHVDLSTLAVVAKDVEDLPTLRKCLDVANIVKHENGATVLLTSASYQVLTGQLVQHNRSADMLELLAQQQLKLESAIMSKALYRAPFRTAFSSENFESEADPHPIQQTFM